MSAHRNSGGVASKLLGAVGISDLFVIVALSSLILVQLHGFAGDPGVGWHLRSGESIVRAGAIPTHDPFLAGVAGRPWIVEQWLADLAMYLHYAWGGWPLLYAFLTVCYLATYFLILYPTLVTLTGKALVACFAAVFAFKIAQVHFILRPVVFSFLFFSIIYTQVMGLYFALARDADGGKFRKRLRIASVVLPVVTALWVNTHPSFVLGVFIVGLMPACLLIDYVVFGVARAEVTAGRIIQLGALCALCCAVTLLNPFGLALHKSILFLSGSSFAKAYYAEWHGPEFGAYEGKLIEFALVTFLFVLGAGALPKLRWGSFEIALIAIFLHITLGAVRMLPFFGIAISVQLAEAFALIGSFAAFERIGILRRTKRAFNKLEARERQSYLGVPLSVAASLVLIGFAVVQHRVLFFNGDYGPPRNEFPYAAVDRLLSELHEGQRAVVVNYMDWGGFITFHGAQADKSVQAVIDDRTTMIGEDFYRKYFNAMQPAGDWKGFAKELGAGYLLLKSNTQLTRTIKRYSLATLVYEDELATVFSAAGEGAGNDPNRSL